MQPRLFALLAGLVAVAVAPVATFAQGSLIPPGAPGPVMKTLDQVEPRIPLVAGAPGVAVSAVGGITISESGSYYLTKDLTVSSGDGITITSGDVVVDLSGFTIRSQAGTSEGRAITTGGSGSIEIGSFGSVVVKNGFIAPPEGVTDFGYGFSQGVNVVGTAEGIVINDDTLTLGIQATVVRRCSVKGATITAINAMEVSDSLVASFRVIGIYATGRVSGSTVNDSGVIGAATAISAPLVQDCVVQIATVPSSPSRQIRGIQAKVAKNCYVTGPASTGIEANIAVGCVTSSVVANQIGFKADMP